MTIQQAKEIILLEAAREKRIVLRNTILIGALILIVLITITVLTWDFLQDFLTSSVSNGSNKEGIEKYIPYIAIVGLIAFAYFSVRASVKRGAEVERAFALIEQGENVEFYHEEKKSLTNLPLLVVMLKMDPIYYLTVNIKRGTYTLPLPEVLVVDIKRVLEYGDVEEYEQVIDDIYTDQDVVRGQGIEVSKESEYEVELQPIENFSAFFTEKYGEEILAMEASRSSQKKRGMLVFGVMILFILGFFGVSQVVSPEIMEKHASLIAIVGVMIAGVLIFLIYKYAMRKSTGEGIVDHTSFKKTMLTRMAAYIHPKFKYYENSHVGLPEVYHSRIFQEKVYGITGGDQFIGQYKGVSFQSCTLGLTYRPSFTKDKDPDDDVFSGSYFVAKFPKKFQTNILIFPKKGVMSSFTDNSISTYLNNEGQKVVLEDPEFQKMFTVYCDDQVAARYVLTPAFMEKLKTLNTQYKGNMYYAINGNNIVVASNIGMTMESTADLAGNIFNTTKLDQAFLDKMYVDLVTQLRIIDTLQLSKDTGQ